MFAHTHPSAGAARPCALRRPLRQRRRCADVRAHAPGPTLLSADIGGTNARYQLWGAGGGKLFERTYHTALHDSFEASLAAFLSDAGASGPPAAACFAVAGPVEGDRCELTNLAWSVSAAPLRAAWNTPAVRVINDFEAVGHAVLALRPGEYIQLNAAPRVPRAPIAVLGPGTGLGEALATWDAGAEAYSVWPSEGAHADFAPVGADQRALAALVAAETGETEVEAQCCGASLTRFHAFFAPAGAARLAPSDVSARALAGSCPACAKAVDTFLAVLGGEAANLGLKALSKGGVFIAGGIPLKLLPLITARGAAGPLQAAFSRPGCRFQAVRDSLPLCLVTLPDPGLSGALAVARQEAAALFRAPRDAPA